MFVGIVLFLQTMCGEFHKLFIIKFALYVCMFLCKEIIIKKKDVKQFGLCGMFMYVLWYMK